MGRREDGGEKRREGDREGKRQKERMGHEGIEREEMRQKER